MWKIMIINCARGPVLACGCAQARGEGWLLKGENEGKSDVSMLGPVSIHARLHRRRKGNQSDIIIFVDLTPRSLYIHLN